MKNIIVSMLTIITLSGFATPSMAFKNSTNINIINNLQTFTGQSIAIDENKLTHLVFIDVWRSYEGKGDEEMIAALPEEFLAQSQQIWIQPEINVTAAQLTEFQQYFSQVKPLVIDKQFALMRSLNVWQSPFHVVIQGNKNIFSGDATALTNFIAKKYSIDVAADIPKVELITSQSKDIVKSKEDIGLAANLLTHKIKTSN